MRRSTGPQATIPRAYTHTTQITKINFASNVFLVESQRITSHMWTSVFIIFSNISARAWLGSFNVNISLFSCVRILQQMEKRLKSNNRW